MVIVITQLSNFYQQKPLVAARVCVDGDERRVCMWRRECVCAIMQNVLCGTDSVRHLSAVISC